MVKKVVSSKPPRWMRFTRFNSSQVVRSSGACSTVESIFRAGIQVPELGGNFGQSIIVMASVVMRKVLD